MAITATLPVARVLIADDEENQRTGLAAMIRGWGFAADTAADGQEALDKLLAQPATVLLTDLKMPRMDGFELLRRLPVEGIHTPAIVLTAFGNMETALAAMHDLGAYWFLEKPIQPAMLRVLLERAVVHGRLAEQAYRLQRQLSSHGTLGEMTGQSPAMRRIFGLLEQVGPSRAAVLLTGESGTGKELAARSLHTLSPRAGGPFVALNCAAMPETLIESELFGHEKGAFTGAIERRPGCFELAQNGTLLLDEIGDMPLVTQAKLLRVLEDSRVRRLGGRHELVVDVRLVASTNKALPEAIRRHEFREDLFYRLNVFEIHLPPLRERLEDLPLLAQALLADLNRKHRTQVPDISPEAMELLAAHRWPGNVRELRNAIERAVILAGHSAILPQHLPASLYPPGPRPPGPPPPGPPPSPPNQILIPLGSTLAAAEREILAQTLRLTRGNKSRAAEILGVSLKTIFNRLKELPSLNQFPKTGG
ncbi:MAG: sigma-54 dependent transcriptional regulator [Acidobacteria bacterium]|nr:sigma-54 dependent transcriptional regulator [Acidobacteriota bacterium]